MAVVTYNNFSFHIQHNGYPVMHDHIGTYEFIFVLSGEILHIINDKAEILEQNTLCFLTPTDEHSLKKTQITLFTSVYLSFRNILKHCLNGLLRTYTNERLTVMKK